jgi:hypothetical protein
MASRHARQGVEPFLDCREARFVDGDRISKTTRIEREFAEAVDQLVSVLEERSELRMDGGEVCSFTGRGGEAVGGGSFIAAARVGDGEGGFGDARRVAKAEALAVQLRILTRPESEHLEILDEVASAL